MKIIHTPAQWQQQSSLVGGKYTELGFIPTMGNLHEGHVSLIEKSLNENDFTVVSS